MSLTIHKALDGLQSTFLVFILFFQLYWKHWGLPEWMEEEEQARNKGRRLHAWRLEAKQPSMFCGCLSLM